MAEKNAKAITPVDYYSKGSNRKSTPPFIPLPWKNAHRISVMRTKLNLLLWPEETGLGCV
jgi:hypothetical protein